MSVNGRYPDSVGALFQSSIGRAPTPTYFAVTGKGTTHTEAGGGGWGAIHPARVGESTVLATSSIGDGQRIVTVRGPKLARSFITAKDGCRPGELAPGSFPPPEARPARAGRGARLVDRKRVRVRLADGKWVAVARLAEPAALRALVIDADGAFWASGSGKAYKLREGPRGRVPADDTCKSWFVYLYPASSTNGAKYTYPATRKALAKFPQVADIALVEVDGWPKLVGVTVASKSQGDAVITHVKANMKDEDPKLFCFAPKTVRRIDMNAKP